MLKYLKIHDGIEIHNAADLPARSGLGSSSSFTVGLLNALYGLKGTTKTAHDLAMEAIHVEQNLIGENVGSQDQVATAFGGFNKITLGLDGSISVRPVNFVAGRRKALNDRLMFFFLGFSRIASEIAGEWIKSVSKKEADLKIMRTMVDEGVAILEDPKRNLDDFGRLLHEAWTIKRGLNHAITTDHIDGVYALARQAGALGGKLLGAGKGGFMVIYADPAVQPAIRKALAGIMEVPFSFDTLGSVIIQSDSAPLNA